MAPAKPANTTLSMAFLAATGIFLLVGLLLFIFAESIATLPANARGGNAWPWPIGPLALRFVASLLLSGALASYLVSRRPDRPTVEAFASVATVLSAALLVHLVVNAGAIDWAKPLSYLWAALLVIGLVGSVLLLIRVRAASPATDPMPATPTSARTIALSIFILTVLVGLTMFLLPAFSRERWPWDLANLTNVQLLGAVFTGVGTSSFLSWRKASWYGYDIFYPAAGTFATVALVACFMHWNLFQDHPITSWIFVIVYILGAVMGFYPYFRYAPRPARSVQPQAS